VLKKSALSLSFSQYFVLPDVLWFCTWLFIWGFA